MKASIIVQQDTIKIECDKDMKNSIFLSHVYSLSAISETRLIATLEDQVIFIDNWVVTK